MSRSARVLAAVVGGLLLIASTLLASRARLDVPVPGPATPSADEAEAAPPPSFEPSPTGDPGTLLRDPEAAAVADPEALLAAGLAVAEGDWSVLGAEAWPPVERPVYVAAATITDRRRVTADVVIAFRADRHLSLLPLRSLPAASALSDVVGSPDVIVQRGGRAAPHEVDGAGALLTVTLDPPAAPDEAVSLRVQISYELAPRDQIVDDGGPAGFGLLATNPDVSLLGHWLPVLTVEGNDGPMLPWGDVGAFPAAVWSLQVEHGEDVFVSGGSDGPCPARANTGGCTWARGTALRDVSAAVYAADVIERRGLAAGISVRSWGPPAVPASALSTALDEAVAGVELFTDRFGPLAWNEFDVIAAPLSSGAAGMEFPGLVVIRSDTYAALDGGFGTYVIAHEVAHQWFHALLGNGSLSDPVVDESLAQYAAVLYYAHVYGEGAADALVDRYMTSRMQRYRDGGGPREPAGQPLGDFEGPSSYGPIVYGRGALAWVSAEQAIGRDDLIDFIRGLVQRHGLDGFVTDELVREEAVDAGRLPEFLDCYWFNPDWTCG